MSYNNYNHATDFVFLKYYLNTIKQKRNKYKIKHWLMMFDERRGQQLILNN